MAKRLLLAFVVLAAGTLIVSGGYQQLEPERFKALVRGSGGAGPVLFLLAFGVLQPLGPSGHLFVLAASLVWSAPLAFGLSLLGATLGQLNAYLFYRYVAHDWAQSRIPGRLAPYGERLRTQPFRMVLILRLLTFTWPLAPAALGISGVPVLPMLAATVLGLAPTVALDVWLGANFLAQLLDGLW